MSRKCSANGPAAALAMPVPAWLVRNANVVVPVNAKASAPTSIIILGIRSSPRTVGKSLHCAGAPAALHVGRDPACLIACQQLGRHVRFTPKADIGRHRRDVRFVP